MSSPALKSYRFHHSMRNIQNVHQKTLVDRQDLLFSLCAIILCHSSERSGKQLTLVQIASRSLSDYPLGGPYAQFAVKVIIIFL